MPSFSQTGWPQPLAPGTLSQRVTLKNKMALDHSTLGLEKIQIRGKQIRTNFLRSTSLLYKILPTNLGVCKTNLLYFLYITSEVKQYYSIYHTDLGQNAVFHNFSRQIALSQYSGRSIVGFKRNRSKISKITHTASWFSFL